MRHDEFGAGWVQGSGVGRVTVRLESPGGRPGRIRTFRADDPALRAVDSSDVAREALVETVARPDFPVKPRRVTFRRPFRVSVLRLPDPPAPLSKVIHALCFTPSPSPASTTLAPRPATQHHHQSHIEKPHHFRE